MSVTYDRDDAFMGVSMTQFRDLLRSWHRSGSVGKAADSSAVGLDRRTAAALIDEADAQGLFARVADARGHVVYGPTSAGEAVLKASPMRPLPRAKAKPIIDALLERCVAINARNDLPFAVDSIWLFGSYAKGVETINDIDVVVDTVRTERWNAAEDKALSDRYITMAGRMGAPGFIQSRLWTASNAIDYIKAQLIHGERKNPRLSFSSIATLKNLSCECQMVFDRRRDGPVEDPVLASHPRATGERHGIGAPLCMPDMERIGSLSLTSLERVDGNWAADYDVTTGFTFADGVPDMLLLGGHTSPQMMKRICEAGNEFAAWMGERGALNGRGAGVIAAKSEGGEQPAVAFAVDRAMWLDGDAYVYEVNVMDVFTSPQSEDNPDGAMLTAKAATAHMISLVGADMEKITRHAVGLGIPGFVDVHIGCAPHPLAIQISAHLSSVMREREEDWLTPNADEVLKKVAVSTRVIPTAATPAPGSRLAR